MKSNNFYAEDLSPWNKMTTPPVSPINKGFPIMNQTYHKRVYTSMVQSKIEKKNDSVHYSPEDSFVEYIKDNAHLPEIEFTNKAKQENYKRTSQNFYKHVKELILNDDNAEAEYESQHITHQYFPYRMSSCNYRMKFFAKDSAKNVFTYKLKKKQRRSFNPGITKNYVFWNQRKLVSSRNDKVLQ